MPAAPEILLADKPGWWLVEPRSCQELAGPVRCDADGCADRLSPYQRRGSGGETSFVATLTQA